MSSDLMWSHTITGPATITERQVAAPTADDLRSGQALLRVLAGGICGSDMPFFKGMIQPSGEMPADGEPGFGPPGTHLHEVVGEVVASTAGDLAVGATVVGWATKVNAMAEYIVVDAADVYAFSSNISPSVAIMLQPLACVVYAVGRLQDVEGSHVAVVGQGSTGILFSSMLKDLGAARVTGVDRVDRSDVAGAFGVDDMVWSNSDRWAAAVADGPDAERPDIVIEAVGHQVSTLVDATSALAQNGQIYYFGIPDDPIYPFPMLKFLRSLGRLYSGYTPVEARRECLRRAEEYVIAHPELVGPYLSHAFKFADAQEAFMSALNPASGQLKVTLEV